MDFLPWPFTLAEWSLVPWDAPPPQGGPRGAAGGGGPADGVLQGRRPRRGSRRRAQGPRPGGVPLRPPVGYISYLQKNSRFVCTAYISAHNAVYFKHLFWRPGRIPLPPDGEEFSNHHSNGPSPLWGNPPLSPGGGANPFWSRRKFFHSTISFGSAGAQKGVGRTPPPRLKKNPGGDPSPKHPGPPPAIQNVQLIHQQAQLTAALAANTTVEEALRTQIAELMVVRGGGGVYALMIIHSGPSLAEMQMDRSFCCQYFPMGTPSPNPPAPCST